MPDRWTWTDDSDDPCSLCVTWEIPKVSPEVQWVFDDDAEPYGPDGALAPRVYRLLHAGCVALVAEMEANRG